MAGWTYTYPYYSNTTWTTSSTTTDCSGWTNNAKFYESWINSLIKKTYTKTDKIKKDEITEDAIMKLLKDDE